MESEKPQLFPITEFKCLNYQYGLLRSKDTKDVISTTSVFSRPEDGKSIKRVMDKSNRMQLFYINPHRKMLRLLYV